MSEIVFGSAIIRLVIPAKELKLPADMVTPTVLLMMSSKP